VWRQLASCHRSLHRADIVNHGDHHTGGAHVQDTRYLVQPAVTDPDQSGHA
jgi:hypothetical protein